MLGVRVDRLKKESLREILTGFLFDSKQHTIFTPNPEMLVLAQKDPAFRDILNASDLNIPDGFGLILASRFLEGKRLERITGVETLQMLAQICVTEGKKLMLLGGDPGVAHGAAEKLGALADDGGPVAYRNGRWYIENQVVENIKKTVPDVLAVAFGHGKQERFIHDFLHKLPSVKIAIGVGGALDYLGGTVPRAPLFMRKMGIEWLFRLVREPRRLPRIWTAVVIFPWLIFRAKIRGV